ncbi:MAG: dockerin type I domain-containing protein [candidate division Zixibacteria bacterium]|nr:dockerin type I domain-containing protein [candidate division Zixibacteria bacterium]
MIRKPNLILVTLLFLFVSFENSFSQSPSQYALIKRPVFQNPLIWKLTKSVTNSLWGKNLFGDPHSAVQSYMMNSQYELLSAVGFQLDNAWNRIVYSECLDDWMRAYGSFGSGTGQFNSPNRLDCEAPCDEQGALRYYYIYVSDALNNRIVKLRYDWWFGYQTMINDGAITGNGLDLPQDLDINNGFDFSWIQNDYLWILNGNSQIKRYDLYEGAFKSTYGSYGHGVGQFCHPTAVVSGRSAFLQPPYDPYANNDHFYVADRGNNRIVWLIKAHGLSEYITWCKELYLDRDIVDLETDIFGQLWAVDKTNGQLLKYTYDLRPLCIFGSEGTGENQFYRPMSFSNTGGYLGCGNSFVSEAWTDSSGGQYFAIGTDVLDLKISSDQEHHLHNIQYTLIDPAKTTLRIYDESSVLIKSLMTNQTEYSGSCSHSWNGTNNSGAYVPTGRYRVVVIDSSVYRNSLESGNPPTNYVTREAWFCHTHPSDSLLYGDANGDKKISVSDVVYLINSLFKGGDAPQCDSPYQCADANCDNEISVSDMVYLINYLFKGGPAPC